MIGVDLRLQVTLQPITTRVEIWGPERPLMTKVAACEVPARGFLCSPLSMRTVSVGKEEESRKSFTLISIC
ncbi:hypothetical protein TNCV_989411 [Trichonephila clavipes]|nr:hypothetical protein TNCV_989411 [Trichonephila clavipes]